MIETGLSGPVSLILLGILAICVGYLVLGATGWLIRDESRLPFDQMEPGDIAWWGDLGVATYPDGTYWMAEFGPDRGMLWERDDATEAEVIALLRERGEIE